MTSDWRDSLAGARMQVDRQFEGRVADSEFSSQEWGLIMTAVEFDVENPEDPDEADLYADTEKLPQIVPELQRIEREMGGSPTPVEDGDRSGGLLGTLRDMFGDITGDRDTSSDSERLAKAEVLVQAYADELQSYLEKQGRWEDVRMAAGAESDREE